MKGSLGYSDHVLAELRVLRADRRLKNKLIALNLRRADFGLLKDLLDRDLWKGSRKLVNIQESPLPSSRQVTPNRE